MVEPDSDKDSIVVNMDNDNFVTHQFLEDLTANADGLSSGAIKGVFFKHPQCLATTGRIACSMKSFMAAGGYDEDLDPLGYEDVSWPCMYTQRLALVMLLMCFYCAVVVPLFSM